MYTMLTHNVKDATGEPRYVAPMETMGNRIKLLRERRGLTQTRLGKLVGVSRAAVAQWENDSVQNIRLPTFLALLEALAADPIWLGHGTTERKPLPSLSRQRR